MHASFSLLCLSVYPSSHVTTVAEEFNGNGGLKLAFNQNSFCYRGISFLTLLPPCLFTTLHDQGCVIPCKICATIIFHFSQYMPSFTQRNWQWRRKIHITPMNRMQIPILGYALYKHCLKSTHLCASLSFCGWSIISLKPLTGSQAESWWNRLKWSAKQLRSRNQSGWRTIVVNC